MMKFVLNKPGYIIVWSLLFAICGPLLGAIQFVTYMSFYGGLRTFSILPFAFIYSMVFFIPALLTGLIVSAYKEMVHKIRHLFALSLIGPVLTYLWLIFIAASMDNNHYNFLILFVAYSSTFTLTSLLYYHSRNHVQ